MRLRCALHSRSSFDNTSLHLPEVRQTSPHFGQALGGFHEFHPRHVRTTAAADAAERPFRLGQQATALVKPQGLDRDTGGPGKGTDGEVFRTAFRSH